MTNAKSIKRYTKAELAAARRRPAAPVVTAPSYEDMLEAFIDAAASAGLEPVEDAFNTQIDRWVAEQGWEAGISHGDSYTLARFIPDDERIDLVFCTVRGVIIAEHSFRFSRLDLRLFEQCAAVAP